MGCVSPCIITFLVISPAPPEFYTLSLHDALPIYPSSLMIGLLAEVEDDEGTPDQTELSEIRWITRDEAKKLLKGDLERSEEHTSELQSRFDIVCRLLLEKKK